MNEKEVNNLIADALENLVHPTVGNIWLPGQQSAIHHVAKQLRKGEQWPQLFWLLGEAYWWEMCTCNSGKYHQWAGDRKDTGPTGNSVNHLEGSPGIFKIAQPEADYLARKFTVPEGWEIGELKKAGFEDDAFSYVDKYGNAIYENRPGDVIFLNGYRWRLRRKVCSKCGRSCNCGKEAT